MKRFVHIAATAIFYITFAVFCLVMLAALLLALFRASKDDPATIFIFVSGAIIVISGIVADFTKETTE